MTRVFRAIGIAVAVSFLFCPAWADDLPQTSTPALVPLSSPTASLQAGATPMETPSVETPLHRLYCVEYARLRSGLAIFGNANLWWSKARNLYSEMTTPVANAVMVFARNRRITKGHVAVVTRIVSNREIRVDQANWQNHGEIDHAIPVLDVSRANDWSRVRVWNIATGQYGAHVYPVSGFITGSPIRQATNN